MKKINNLTEGPIFKSLMALAVPVIFANILQTAYQLTDTFWVGRLGASAVAAVSISFPFIFFMVSIGGGFAMAGTILVAHYTGREDRRSVDHVTSQTMALIAGLSLVLSIAGYILAPSLLRLVGTEEHVFDNAVLYLKISFAGMVFVYIYMVFQSLMRGVGDVTTPLYLVLATVLLNLVLDPLFIFGYGRFPGFGILGAAIATIGSEGLAACIGVILLLKGRYRIRLHIADMKPDRVLIKKMISIGLPASVEQAVISLGLTIMTVLVATFGTNALAVYGIGGRILSFIIIPSMGLSMATATLVGQNIGAHKIERATTIAIVSSITGFLVLTLVGIVVYIFAAEISAFFIPGDSEAIEGITHFVRIMALTFGFLGAGMSLNGTFRGAGNTVASMLFSTLTHWLLRFPIAYLLSKYTALAVVGVWVAFPVANVISALVAVSWFLKGRWKHTEITEEVQLITETTNEAIIEEGL